MNQEKFSKKETKQRFEAILRGAMHKPTLHKDVPHKRKRKAAKPSSSGSSRAT